MARVLLYRHWASRLGPGVLSLLQLLGLTLQPLEQTLLHLVPLALGATPQLLELALLALELALLALEQTPVDLEQQAQGLLLAPSVANIRISVKWDFDILTFR